MNTETKTATVGLLNDAIREAAALLSKAQMRKRAYESLPENHEYPDLSEAEGWISARLEGYAQEDCEGSHNCGKSKYTQRFTAGGKLYDGTLEVEYNRHDKTYYYVDGAEFSAVEAEIEPKSENRKDGLDDHTQKR